MVILWVIPYNSQAALSVFLLRSVIDAKMKSDKMVRMMSSYLAQLKRYNPMGDHLSRWKMLFSFFIMIAKRPAHWKQMSSAGCCSAQFSARWTLIILPSSANITEIKARAASCWLHLPTIVIFSTIIDILSHCRYNFWWQDSPHLSLCDVSHGEAFFRCALCQILLCLFNRNLLECKAGAALSPLRLRYTFYRSFAENIRFIFSTLSSAIAFVAWRYRLLIFHRAKSWFQAGALPCRKIYTFDLSQRQT